MVCFVWFVCTGWTFCWVPWGSLGGSLGMLGGVLGSPWGEGHWGVPARLAAQGACFVASGGPFAGPCGSWWIPWGPLGGVLVDSLEAPWGSWEGVLGFPCGGGRSLGSPLVWLHGVNVLWGPLRVPWRVLGAPGAFLGVPWGKSVRVPACLTAQSVRLVGSFGGPLEGLGRSRGASLGLLGGGLGDPRSFGCTGCTFHWVP